MAQRNTIIGLPPNNLDLVKDPKLPSDAWGFWFNVIHRKVSPDRVQQTITAASAVNIDCIHCNLNSTTGAFAITLDPPTSPSVELAIELKANPNAHSVTLSLTNVAGGSHATTCTWSTVGGTLFLKSNNSSKWIVQKEFNVTLT